MQARWLIRRGNRKVAVIALGWACGPQLVGHIRPQGYDVLALYDYSGIGEIIAGIEQRPDITGRIAAGKELVAGKDDIPDTGAPVADNSVSPDTGTSATNNCGTQQPGLPLKSEGASTLTNKGDSGPLTVGSPGGLAELKRSIEVYPFRLLVAWSFGVWAAERLFAGTRFDRAVAVNGTPLPADETAGIGARRLAVTLRGIEKGGLEEFNRKAYGPHAGLAEDVQSERSPAALTKELSTLVSLAAVPYLPARDWTLAVVGRQDGIFPPENMLRYWGDRAREVNSPHYPFGDETILKLLF
ncbi:MAG: DUF452 family protein [Alistipes sp.]|nr:DUF452 family protein [Alistipes sp.]